MITVSVQNNLKHILLYFFEQKTGGQAATPVRRTVCGFYTAGGRF
jgi:hypothetical protein